MSISPAPRSPSPIADPVPKLNKYGKPMKSVRWAEEARLEAIRYFECEEGERGKNQTGLLIQFTDSFIRSGQRKDYHYNLPLFIVCVSYYRLTFLFKCLQVFIFQIWMSSKQLLHCKSFV